MVERRLDACGADVPDTAGSAGCRDLCGDARRGNRCSRAGARGRESVRMTVPRFRSWAVTHPGARRAHNEDAYVDRPDLGIWAVADGAGGHAAGELASSMIANALQAIPAGLSAPQLLAHVRLAIERTHTALREEAARRGPDVLVASTVV